MLKRLSFKTKKSGFSLAEILVSLFIISLLIFTFTPLILFSFSNIYNAGEERAKLLEDKGNVELQIADGEGVGNDAIPVGLLDSSGNAISGTSGVYQVGMESSGDLKAHVIDALSASISISPSHVTKNYNNKKIYIYGENVSFNSPPAKFTLVRRSGSTDYIEKTENFNPISPGDDTIAEFTLPNGLVTENKYFIKFGNLEAQLYIDPQSLIAVGANGKYFEASDEQNWSIEKTVSGATGNLNALAYDGERFIAVDSGGNIFNTKTSGDYGWEKLSTNQTGATKLNDVLFSNDTYYVAGSSNTGAQIYEKQGWNGTWSNLKTDNQEEDSWNGYYVLNDSKLVLIGQEDNNDIFYSLEPNNQIKYYESREETYFDIWSLKWVTETYDGWVCENFDIYNSYFNNYSYSYGNINDLALYEYLNSDSTIDSTFKCCTSDGYILTKTSDGWVYDNGYGRINANKRYRPANAITQLNSICYGNGYWVAVGTGQYAMVRQEGNYNWQAKVLPSASGTTVLNKVIFYDGKFYAVGKNAAIYYSVDNGMTWTKSPITSGADLYDIAGR